MDGGRKSTLHVKPFCPGVVSVLTYRRKPAAVFVSLRKADCILWIRLIYAMLRPTTPQPVAPKLIYFSAAKVGT